MIVLRYTYTVHVLRYVYTLIDTQIYAHAMNETKNRCIVDVALHLHRNANATERTGNPAATDRHKPDRKTDQNDPTDG